MPKLEFLRVAPFTFDSFIGDWKWIEGFMGFKDSEVEQGNLDNPVDVYDHDFTEGSEGDFDLDTRLRKLQAALLDQASEKLSNCD